MSRATTARTAFRVFVTGLMLVTALAPSAYALYRCQSMGQSFASPCCPDDDSASHAASTAELSRERCCTKHLVELERAPAQITQREDGPGLLALGAPIAWADSPRLCLLPSLLEGERARQETGPPLRLRVCSLLL